MFSLIATLIALGALSSVGGAYASNQIQKNEAQNYYKDLIRQQYGDQLTDAQIDALYAQYEKDHGLFNWSDPRTYMNLIGGPIGWAISGISTAAGMPAYGYDNFDTDGLNKMMADIEAAYGELGEQPDAPTEQDLDKIMEEAYAEIDAENNRLLDMYKDTFLDTKTTLDQELQNNNAMFSDYRNQVLTNDIMSQQAIAGATRYELDRQQRNAISRGASAAQRLVNNINTSLGLQAQSAQQALNTSNVLAQNLLNHRQAQQGIRSAYLDSRNAYNAQVANNLAGQAERRFNYGRAKRQDAIDKYNYAYDTWNDRVNNYFQGNSLGAGIYRSRYGSGGRNNSNKNTNAI